MKFYQVPGKHQPRLKYRDFTLFAPSSNSLSPLHCENSFFASNLQIPISQLKSHLIPSKHFSLFYYSSLMFTVVVFLPKLSVVLNERGVGCSHNSRITRIIGHQHVSPFLCHKRDCRLENFTRYKKP